MSDKITVELTLEQARVLAEDFKGAALVIRDALAEHDRQQRLERYRLPWGVVRYRLPWGVVRERNVMNADADVLAHDCDPADAKLIAAAPKLAEAAKKVFDECRRERDEVPDPVAFAVDALAAALDESGWPRGGQ